MSLNDEIRKMRAMNVYKSLLSFLDQKGWKYSTPEGRMIVNLNFVGEDIPMPIIFEVDEDVQILKVISFMPFSISQDNLIDICMAISYTNNHLPFGTFNLDMDHKILSYRNSTCFVDGEIGAETFDLLIDIACTQIDRYNDRFLALEKGIITLEDFISID